VGDPADGVNSIAMHESVDASHLPGRRRRHTLGDPGANDHNQRDNRPNYETDEHAVAREHQGYIPIHWLVF